MNTSFLSPPQRVCNWNKPPTARGRDKGRDNDEDKDRDMPKIRKGKKRRGTPATTSGQQDGRSGKGCAWSVVYAARSACLYPKADPNVLRSTPCSTSASSSDWMYSCHAKPNSKTLWLLQCRCRMLWLQNTKHTQHTDTDLCIQTAKELLQRALERVISS